MNFTLSDCISIILLNLEGGPVRLALIKKQLMDKGVDVSESELINCMKRYPQRFSRSGRGMYALAK